MKALILTAACCALVATPVLAQSPQSKTKTSPPRSVPIKRVFPYYDIYLGLPPQDRDGLRMQYKFLGPPGAPRPQVTYALGTTRIPMEISPTGVVLNMPNAALYANGTIEIAAGQPRGGIGMDIQPVIPLSRSMPVAVVINPLTDYSNAIRRAGPLAIMAPRLSGIRFVGGAGGEVVFADGRRAPLPAHPEGGVVFKPTLPAMRGATSLSFGTAPTSAAYAQ